MNIGVDVRYVAQVDPTLVDFIGADLARVDYMYMPKVSPCRAVQNGFQTVKLQVIFRLALFVTMNLIFFVTKCHFERQKFNLFMPTEVRIRSIIM